MQINTSLMRDEISASSDREFSPRSVNRRRIVVGIGEGSYRAGRHLSDRLSALPSPFVRYYKGQPNALWTQYITTNRREFEVPIVFAANSTSVLQGMANFGIGALAPPQCGGGQLAEHRTIACRKTTKIGKTVVPRHP